MRISRGDLVLVLFPHSDLRTFKKRPALVVQADGLRTGMAQSVLALITSNVARGGHPSRVDISLKTTLGHQSGLRANSLILTDNLVTVQHTLIERVIGIWADMLSIDRALRHTLGL